MRRPTGVKSLELLLLLGDVFYFLVQLSSPCRHPPPFFMGKLVRFEVRAYHGLRLTIAAGPALAIYTASLL